MFNNITNAGATALAQSLTKNNSIEQIDLSQNNIGGQAAHEFLKALNLNSCIQLVDFEGNKKVSKNTINNIKHMIEHPSRKFLVRDMTKLNDKFLKMHSHAKSIAQSKETTAAKNSELKRELRNLRSTNDIAVAENATLREKNEELRKEIESKDEILLRMENLTKSNEMTIAENTELKKRVETLKQLFKSQCEKVRDVETVKKASDEELRKRIDELHEEIERKDLEMKRTSTLKKVTKWTSVETKQITNTPLPEQVAIQIQGVGTAAMQSAVDEYRKEIDSLKVKAKVEKEQLLSRLKSAENELDGLKQIVARNKEEQNSLKKLQKGTLDQLVEKLKVISDLQKVNEKLSKDVERKETTLKQITDLIGGRSTDKEKELESTIAQDRKEISSLKEQLKNSRPIETVDVTNANEIEWSTSSDGGEDSTEEEPPQKRRHMESNLAIALEQTQQMVKVKEEAMQRAAEAEASVEAARREKDAAAASLRNVKEQSQQTVSVKQEAIQRAAAAEASVEAARREKEDANEVVTQQTLATDIWQGRFDEIFELARAAGVDGKTLSEIRHRPLSSGS
ncbi:hypothetical protein ACHAXM_002505 [Skeletonema potamos]